MRWPQIFILVWLLLELLVGAYSHGKPRDGKHNFAYTVISVALLAIPLWIGGFWS